MSPRVFTVALGLLLAAVPSFAQDIQSLIDNGHLRRALAATNALPHNALAAYYRSQIALNLPDQAADALADAQTSVSLEPNNPDFQCNLAQSAGARAQNAGTFERIKLLRIIHAASDKGLQLDPKNITCLQLMMNLYQYAPSLLGGDKKKAIETANRILSIDQVKGNLALAGLADDNKQPAAADAYRVKAAVSAGDTFHAHIQLGRQYLRAKDFTHAESEARTALAQRPGNFMPYLLLAQALGGQDKWAAVETILTDGKRAVPDNLSPFYGVARDLLVQNKELPRAERYLREYLAATPELGQYPLPAAHWRLGLVLEKQNRKPEALRELQEAVREDPKLEAAKKDLDRLSKS